MGRLGLVFGSPVPGPPKDRDWTGPRPARTENLMDRLRPQPAVRSSVLQYSVAEAQLARSRDR
jgi:hypothetical protein